MSSDTIQQRPIFASEEQNLLTPNRPPVSRLAIFSLIAGIISSIALFNLDLVALPILATVLGLAAYMMTAKNEGVSGQSLALVGMGLGVAFGIACFTRTNLRDRYLFAQATEFAQQFLDVVGQNKLLEAYEMTRSEPERQVAGTSLEEAYKNAGESAKENIDAFKKREGLVRAVTAGPNAEWVLESPVRVLEVQDQSMHVAVRMIDVKSKKSVELTLNRDFHLGIGSWHVVDVK
jgi:hypothetical protein